MWGPARMGETNNICRQNESTVALPAVLGMPYLCAVPVPCSCGLRAKTAHTCTQLSTGEWRHAQTKGLMATVEGIHGWSNAIWRARLGRKPTPRVGSV